MAPLDLHDAVRATVAGRTAVIAVSVRYGSPLGKHLLLGQNGVADLGLRRAHLRGEIETIHDATTKYERRAEDRGWRRADGGEGPFWPLDLGDRQLLRQEFRGTRSHRGERVACHRLEVAVAGRRRSGGLLRRREPPARRFVDDVELWLGDDGRIRLAALSGRILDALPPTKSALMRDVRSAFGLDGRPLWRTVELFSFGVGAEITTPRADELLPRVTRDDLRAAGQLAAKAWRHRREIRRYLGSKD